MARLLPCLRGMSRAFVLRLLLAAVAGSALAPPQRTVAAAPSGVWADGFASLRGIAVDGDDRVYVADREAGTVTRLDQHGVRTVVARHLERPIGVAIDAEARLLVAEERAARVVR